MNIFNITSIMNSYKIKWSMCERYTTHKCGQVPNIHFLNSIFCQIVLLTVRHKLILEQFRRLF